MGRPAFYEHGTKRTAKAAAMVANLGFVAAANKLGVSVRCLQNNFTLDGKHKPKASKTAAKKPKKSPAKKRKAA